MLDIQEYLESKGLWVKPAGANNIHTPCPIHGESNDKPGRLYINVDSSDDKYGVYLCFVCNAKGNFNNLRAHFGDEAVHLDASELGIEYNPIYEVATQYYSERLLDNPEVYRYLTEDRGLNDKTIIKARLGWADGTLSNHLLSSFSPEQIKESGLVDRFSSDYFKDEIIFPYLDYGRPMQLRGKKIDGKMRGMMGVAVGLYGIDSIIGEDTVHIVEGEIDCLTMHQLGFAAVGVPGVQTWKDAWSDYIEEAKRAYILFDNDKPGKAGAEKLATNIGPRSRIVELPKKGSDVNDWVVKHGKNREDFDYLFSKAKGGLLVSVNEAYDRWVEIEGNNNLTGLRFNIDEIDRVMTHGALPGQVITMIARTNSGKTIMSINYFQRMKMLKPDIKILYMSLEQTRNEWFERAHRINNFYNPGASVVDTVNYWKDSFYLVDKNKVSEVELQDSIYQFAYESGSMPDLIAIDYLGYYAKGCQGASEYDRMTNAIMGIKGIAKETQTVIYAPHQGNRSGEFGKELQADQGRGAGTVEETTDMMMSLWAPDQAITGEDEQGKGEVLSRIIKSRNGGVGQLIKYQFAPLTLAMIPFSDPLYERALQERLYASAGDDWKAAVVRHKTGNMALDWEG